MNAGTTATSDTRCTAQAALARCAMWIAAEPDLAAALARHDAPEQFRDALRELLVQRGDREAAALIAADFRHDGANATRLANWPLSQRRGWQPFALELAAHGAELVWGCGAPRADAPFHELTVMALRSRPINRAFAVRTPLTPAFVATLEAEMLPPAGLILHMSRCGSTLLAQLLKAWPDHRVISEPGLLDTALMLALGGHDPTWRIFRGVLAALCQPAQTDRRVLIKLDAWHALALAQLQQHLPGVPWLFVYRDPVEVLVSHRREPGRHTVPGMLPPAWLGQLPATHASLPLLDYSACVLGAICAAVVAHAEPGNLLNYAQLVTSDTGDTAVARLPAPLLRRFGLDAAQADPALLATAWKQHAKQPHQTFSDDREHKHNVADSALRDAAQRWIAPHYAALEALRGGARI